MVSEGGLTDSHLHICEEGFPGWYADLGSLELCISCTSRPAEWDLQRRKAPDNCVLSFGVHPWHSGEWDIRSRERLTEVLSLDRRYHVGEIGLDAKSGDVREQVPSFAEQLSIASDMDRVASIHMVGAEKEVLDIVRRAGCRTLLHSFSSESYARPFCDAGSMLSVSPRILARSEERIKRLLEAIPEDRLLLESDAPNQRNFTGMGDFVSRIAELKGMEPSELAALVSGNLRGLLR